MTPREIVLDAIAHQETPQVPYTFSFEEVVGAKLDAHYGSSAWRDEIKQYIVWTSAVDTDLKTVIDERFVRDGYGGIWRQDCRPWHLEKPPLDQPEWGDYVFPSAQEFLRPDWKAEAVKTCEENQKSFMLANLGWGLFERSWNLRGFENALMDCITDPDFFGEMLDKLCALYLEFVEYTADLPVDGILFGDDWGDQRGNIVGPDRWRKLIKPRWARIYERVHHHGKIVMHHSCGSIAEILPDIIEIGVDVMESCQPEARGMNPFELKRKFGDKITFWGALGSQSTIPNGTPDELRTAIRRLKSEMSVDGGYILAPAKPLQPETPAENAAAILETFNE